VFVLCATPPLLLLFAQHRAITGSYFETPQHYYYARADGPPGCFHLGWGSGCHYEHRDAVEMQGGAGLTPLWSLLNTLHRLHWHSLDVANFEPLFVLGLWTLWRSRKRPNLRTLMACFCVLPLGYSLFYFNGSYPGGGARFFSELIPLWHGLIALGLVRLRAVRWGVAAAFFGFSLHATFSHEELRSSHFGPHPSKLDDASRAKQKPPSLVFVSTAHHFNLLAQASPDLIAARNTLDSRPWLTSRATPGATTLQFDAEHGLSPLQLLAPRTLRFESESDYPVLGLSGAWVYPESLPHACVSMGKALRIERSGASARVQLELLGETPAAALPVASLYDVYVMLIDGRAAPTQAPCQRSWVTRSSNPRTLTLDFLRWPWATHLDAIELVPQEP